MPRKAEPESGMIFMLSRLCAVAILVAASTQALAAQQQFIGTADLLAAYDQGDTNARQLILLGLSQVEGGMAVANVELQAKGAAPLYCVPPQLVLTGEQILDIVRRYAAAHPDIGQSSYTVTVLKAAEDVFPCRGN
jgi:hypothetical protein